MDDVPEAFEYDYFGSDIVYGRERVQRLGETLDRRGLERALVVCGSNVGANNAVMDPLREGLAEKHAGTFDETTPGKSIETIFDGIDVIDETGANVLIGVGGGSSLDVARQLSYFEADERSRSDIYAAARTGDVPAPEPTQSTIPVVVVPTTLAGAAISETGKVEVLSAEESHTGQPIRAGGSVMPIAMVYDPDLYEATPTQVLAGSAMNGFNKGIETLYSARANPITDATAIRGLQLCRESYPHLDDPAMVARAVLGHVLVEFQRRTSVIHAFGHGFARRYPVQQGAIHAVLAPHVLRYLFSNVSARRGLLAQALDVDSTGRSDDELADAIVERVVAVRDSLGLPTNLREIGAVERERLPDIAEYVVNDLSIDDAPADLEPTVDQFKEILARAW